jgi:hypothetical protein
MCIAFLYVMTQQSTYFPSFIAGDTEPQLLIKLYQYNSPWNFNGFSDCTQHNRTFFFALEIRYHNEK